MIRKTLLKTLSYATMHMTIAVGVAFAMSGSWKVALAIGLIEPCIQTFAFFFHEKFWHKIEKSTLNKDYHNSIIDSVSPATATVETALNERES